MNSIEYKEKIRRYACNTCDMFLEETYYGWFICAKCLLEKQKEYKTKLKVK